MAQDFKALFDVGVDDKTISMVDADGIALAAIKGLVEEARERDVRIALQDVVIQTLRTQMASQQEQIGVLSATQSQMEEMAAVVSQLKRVLASLRKDHDVALLAK